MKKSLFITAFLFSVIIVQAQNNVGIGTTTPNSNALLELQNNGNPLGLLLPRQDIATFTLNAADAGMMVFNTVDGKVYTWNGTTWVSSTSEWAVNGTDISNLNTGNVGIGINTPGYNLDVNGSFNANSYFLSGSEMISTNGTNGLYFGLNAGHTNQPAFSTFVGNSAGQNTTGISNTFIGTEAGLANTTGNQNVFLGLRAGEDNIDGSSNTFIGRSSGDLNTSGDDNAFLGREAGDNNTTGSRNTIIGRSADVVSGNLINAAAIGYAAQVASSNSLVLGGTGGNAVNVGIGLTAPTNTLDILGEAAIGTNYAGFFNAPLDGLLVEGRTGFGTSSPSTTYQMEIENSSVASGLLIDNNYSGTATQYGLLVSSSNTGGGTKYAIRSEITGLAGDVSTVYGGYHQVFPNGTGTTYGNRTITTGVGTGVRYGVFNEIFVNSGNAATIYGMRSDIDQDGSGTAYGVFSRLDGSGTGTTYGAYIQNLNAGTSDYGIFTTGDEEYNIINAPTTIGSNVNSFSPLTVDGQTTAGAGALTVSSDDTWGTSINIDAGGGGGSVYQLVAAGSTNGTLPAGSFGLLSLLGPLWYVDGTTADMFITPDATQQVSFGSASASNDKVFIGANDNAINTGLDVEITKTNTSTSFGMDIRSAQNGTSGGSYGIFVSAGGSNASTKYGVYSSTFGSGTRWSFYGIGNMFLSGGTYQGSDEQLKTNISELDGALSIVNSIKTYRYNYKQEGVYDKFDFPEGEQFGFMADELENVVPGIVKEGDHAIHTNSNNPNDAPEQNINFKAVNYTGMIPILTEAIKEQQELIQQLEERIQELENK